MSAYIVSRAHIATLAAFALGGAHQISSTRFGGLKDLANLLAAENAASVNYRYQNHEAEAPYVFATDAAVWKHARTDLVRDPVVILKAVQCLEYQSCEHPTWQESEAKLALSHIRSSAIRKLPGYDEAEGWSIDEGPRPKAVLVVLKDSGGVQ